jgi:predicted outer membrane repeat protein
MKKLFFVLIMAISAYSASAATIYVDANGTGDYPTIQEAINNANDGDEIVLLPGTYRGPGNHDVDYNGKAITVRSQDPNDWNVVESTIIDCQGYEGIHFHNSEDGNSILTGLAIKNGGGFYRVDKIPIDKQFPPTYKDQHVYYGGAIACEGASPTIRRCILTKNGYRAAGWDPEGSSIGRGGAIYIEYGSPVIKDCVFEGNTSNEGGAIYVKGIAKIEGCLIINNIADRGGAVCGIIENMMGCRISHNIAYAGAIIEQSLTSYTMLFVNCIFTHNFGQGSYSYIGGWTNSGAIIKGEKSLELINCTMVFNSVYQGHIIESDTKIKLLNSIIQQNSGDLLEGTREVKYSNIQGGLSGEGNIDEAWCCTYDGHHLKAGSRCIDAGTNVNVPDRDIDSEVRPNGGGVDIGADEFVDTDGDGLPDFWEHKYTDSNTAAPALADWDGDGLFNLDEYECYTEPNTAQSTFYVDANEGNDEFDGTAPAWDGTHGPKKTIQAGIDACAERLNDTVIIAPGMYTEECDYDLRFFGKAITVRSTDPQDACVVDATVIDCLGKNNRGFVFNHFESPASVISGLTIKNAYMNLPSSTPGDGFIDPIPDPLPDKAGGIICLSSSPIIANCKFEGNNGKYAGAIGCYCGNLTVQNCRFFGNTANIRNVSGYPIIYTGGTIYVEDSSIKLSDSTFENNTWGLAGGIITICSGNADIVNCILRNNQFCNYRYWYGGVIYAKESTLGVSNCILSGNNIRGFFIYDTSASIKNCVLCGNKGNLAPVHLSQSLLAGGGIVCTGQTSLTLDNSILWDNRSLDGNEMKLWPSSIVDVNYCDIKGGLSGISKKSSIIVNWDSGNIDVDPCFVVTGYWDPNGTDEDETDDFWVDGDYHLLPESLCINAGDPNYIAGPDETDLDGLPRVISGRIDMGPYEFNSNSRPVADAGPDITAYAWIDGWADVKLDGGASCDDDNDVLVYYWSWMIDGNVCEVNGMNPETALPVGEHQIELIVDDGIELSGPDYFTATVIGPARAKLLCMPQVINGNGRGQILAMLSMPKGVRRIDIDSDAPLVFCPGEVQARYFRIFQAHSRGRTQTYIMAWFDKSDCMENLCAGFNNIDIAGRFTSGRYFYGSSRIYVNSHRHRQRRFIHR